MKYNFSTKAWPPACISPKLKTDITIKNTQSKCLIFKGTAQIEQFMTSTMDAFAANFYRDHHNHK